MKEFLYMIWDKFVSCMKYIYRKLGEFYVYMQEVKADWDEVRKKR